jgi:hypothetical protein
MRIAKKDKVPCCVCGEGTESKIPLCTRDYRKMFYKAQTKIKRMVMALEGK